MAEGADRHTAQGRALAFLEKRVAEARTRAELQLPPVKKLAAGARVSPKTMWKGLQTLRARGVVAIVPGGGAFVAPGTGEPLDTRLFEPANVAPPPRVSRAEEVRRALSEDLLAGRFVPGSVLPGYKELQERYSACYLTLRTALARLVSERRLERHGKGFRVHQSPAYRGRPLIAHIYSRYLGQARGLVRATPFAPQFWDEVEKERVRLNIDVELVHHDAALGLRLSPDSGPRLSERYRERSVLGCMVSTLGLNPPELEAVLQEAIAQRWRTSILCEGSEPAVSSGLLHHPLLRFFAFAGGSVAGDIVADFLLRLGHRNVGVINPHREARFTTRRIAGIREAFARAGGCRVVAVDADADEWHDEAMRDAVFRTFRRQAEHYLRLTTPAYEDDGGVFSRVIDLHMGGQFLKRHLVQHFERLLKDSSITAWVCVTDVVGLIALTYLRGMGIRVPEQLSVIAFDNTVDSFGQGLTSYDFNVPAIVHRMIEHVIEPRRTRDRPEPVLEIPGVVMSRMSTGPARS